MSDPRMTGAPIMRRTGCLVGTHVFTWASNSANVKEPDPNLRCDCNTYTWREWQAAAKGEPK